MSPASAPTPASAPASTPASAPVSTTASTTTCASATASAAPPADPTLPRRSSTLAATGQLARLLARPTLADRASWALPVAAMGVASTLALTVVGGVHFFFTTTGTLAGLYRLCAVVALVLLLLPLMTLAAAATRLSATRRDTRLSSLRLLGATRGTLRLLTLGESAATSLAGALLGVAGYLALMPLVGLLHFAGGPIGGRRLWIGVLPVLGAVAGLTLLAVLSSAVGLHRVAISPLGVRTRARAPRTSTWRAVVAVVLVAASSVLAKLAGVQASMLVAGVMCLVMVAAPMLAMNLLGPWLLGRLARRDLGRATGPVPLLAARTVLENPKQAWRQVGPLGLSVFVGVMVGLATSLAGGSSSSPEEARLLADIGTGALVTVAISFLTVACSVAINTTAAVLDRSGLYVGLDMIGMPASMIDAARRRAVMRPLLAVVLVAVAAALALVLPLGASNRLANPLALAVVVGIVAGGVAVVAGGLRVSRATLRQVLAKGLVRSE